VAGLWRGAFCRRSAPRVSRWARGTSVGERQTDRGRCVCSGAGGAAIRAGRGVEAICQRVLLTRLRLNLPHPLVALHLRAFEGRRTARRTENRNDHPRERTKREHQNLRRGTSSKPRQMSRGGRTFRIARWREAPVACPVMALERDASGPRQGAEIPDGEGGPGRIAPERAEDVGQEALGELGLLGELSRGQAATREREADSLLQGHGNACIAGVRAPGSVVLAKR